MTELAAGITTGSISPIFNVPVPSQASFKHVKMYRDRFVYAVTGLHTAENCTDTCNRI